MHAYGSQAKLDPNKKTAYVVVGLTNLPTGPNYNMVELQTLYVDYVLICAPE